MKRHGDLNLEKVRDTGRDLTKREDRNLERMFLSTIHDMEQMFEETFHRPWISMLPHLHTWGERGIINPSVDMYETKDEIVVKAELPGISREEISVKLSDGNLVISGEKKEENTEEREGRVIRMERSYGSFHRVIGLPSGVDDSNVDASFKDGVLEVHLRKKEDTARTVTIH